MDLEDWKTNAGLAVAGTLVGGPVGLMASVALMYAKSLAVKNRKKRAPITGWLHQHAVTNTHITPKVVHKVGFGAYEGVSHENPPRPPGVRILPQKLATPDVTKWAVEIINDSTTYPMHSESVRVFGDRFLLARVEWHTWSTRGQHGKGGDPNARIAGTFRGATFYEVVDPEAFGTYYYQKMQNAGVA